ncbi:MAG: GNAT family N-acetyltransferase, partial [Phycisphaerae bacterium]
MSCAAAAAWRANCREAVLDRSKLHQILTIFTCCHLTVHDSRTARIKFDDFRNRDAETPTVPRDSLDIQQTWIAVRGLGVSRRVLPMQIVQPFSLPATSDSPFGRGVLAPLRTTIEKSLGLNRLNDIYSHVTSREQPEEFASRALHHLGIRLDVTFADAQAIPKSGPIIVVANHPLGGIDGLALLALLQ